MKRSSWAALAPSLLLAAGVLSSTLIAVATSDAGWWVMASPVVMALAIAAAGLLGHRRPEAPRGLLHVALILAASLLLASVIVALRDPSVVAELLPVLGACSAAPMALQFETRRCPGARHGRAESA